MQGSDILGIALGLIFIYLVLSIFVTIINEIIATVLSLRSKNLLKALEVMLDSDKDTATTETTNSDQPQSLGSSFFSHGMFKMLTKDDKSNPSYVDRATFSTIVMDILKGADAAKDASAAVKERIESLPDGNTKETLLALYNDAQGDITSFKTKVEDWFDKMMDRASGWYKRKIKYITISIAIVVTVGLNADTVYIVDKLASDPEARASLDEAATDFTNNTELQNLLGLNSSSSTSTTTNADSAVMRLEGLMVELDSVTATLTDIETITGIGWTEDNDCCNEQEKHPFWCWVLRIVGWILTILAITLGAPFWFDLLKRIVNIRGTGNKPTTTTTTEVKG